MFLNSMLATHPRLPGGLDLSRAQTFKCVLIIPDGLTGRASVSHARVTSYEIFRRPSPFFSATYKMIFAQLLCFENDPFSWGVHVPLQLRAGEGNPATC